MKFSFIITTYNLTEAELRRCLNSLGRQGLDANDFEVIVVDDESDVSPESIVMSYADVLPVRFLAQPHARQGAARNLALRHAQGDFIQFVDGDDYLFADDQGHWWKDMERMQADLFLFGHARVSEYSCPVTMPEKSAFTEITDGKRYMKHHTLFGSCCTLCFSRQLLQLDGPRPLLFAEGIYIEDEEFATRLVWRAQRMAVTTSVRYAYVQRPGSTTHKRDREHIDDLFRAYFTVLDNLQQMEGEEPSPHEGLDRKLHFLSLDILRHALRQDDWQQRFTECGQQLRQRGLFPLPKAAYSEKYRLFRLLSKHSAGRKCLRVAEQYVSRNS